jgi:GNAT superfamily N-acetyltransferase
MPEAGTGFRRARPVDADTIVAMVNAGDSDRTHATEVLELLAVPQSMFLLRFQESEVVGCAYLRKRGNAAFMGLLAVRPAQQGSGVGKRLIAEAERIARDEMHCTMMTMAVIANHRPDVAAFYERRGYSRTGRMEKRLTGYQPG